MTEEERISIIKNTINNRRTEVIKALMDSDIVIPEISSNKDLLHIIISEVKNGNGYLIYNLGEVITKEIEPKKEKKSNIAPLVGAALISTGGGLLGGLFGGGGDKAQKEAQKQAQAAAAAQAAQEAAIQKQMIIAQSQQNAEQIAANVDIQNRKASTARTLTVIGMIGGALLIGTVITVLILKKK